MFNDKYGLTTAVLEGRKTQTRRIATIQQLRTILWMPRYADRNIDELAEACIGNYATEKFAPYRVGEEVAIAQSYKDARVDPFFLLSPLGDGVNAMDSNGWDNKMFVRADLMPHRIKITNVRVERLQDISEEDSLNEGLQWAHGIFYVNYNKENGSRMNLGNDYRNAFATLIDNVSGKGTWESNPLVFVYDFELIK